MPIAICFPFACLYILTASFFFRRYCYFSFLLLFTIICFNVYIIEFRFVTNLLEIMIKRQWKRKQIMINIVVSFLRKEKCYVDRRKENAHYFYL